MMLPLRTVFFVLILFSNYSCRQGGDELSLNSKIPFLKKNEIKGKYTKSFSITKEKIKNQTITSKKIKDHSIQARHLSSMGAQNGALLFWNGNTWTPTSQGPGIQNGKLGIGTSSPLASLDLKDALYLKGSLYIPKTTSNASFSLFADTAIGATTNLRLFISSQTKNIGIGTDFLSNPPKTRLEFRQGQMNIQNSSGNAAFYFPKSGSLNIIQDDDPTNSTPGNSRLYFSGTQERIGIHTKTPNYPLDVNGDVQIDQTLYLKRGTQKTALGKKVIFCSFQRTGDPHIDPLVPIYGKNNVYGWNGINGCVGNGFQHCIDLAAQAPCKTAFTLNTEFPSGSCAAFFSAGVVCGRDEAWEAHVPSSSYPGGGISFWLNGDCGVNASVFLRVIYLCM